MQSLMGYMAGTASAHKIIKMSKREIEKRVALVQGMPNDEMMRTRLLLLESLRDEVIRVKDFKALQMKERYDRRVRAQRYEVGELVLQFDSSLLKQWSRKLDERWLGPYQVIWQGTQGAYTIINGAGKMKMVSGDQLKKYLKHE